MSSASIPNPKTKILILPSEESTPFLELKVLPEYLKYAYPGGRETLPVIIASNLTGKQEESLMSILRKHREAIGWTTNDIKGISPAIVYHRSHLNDETTPRRNPPCRLIPVMQDAVKTEILKL